MFLNQVYLDGKFPGISAHFGNIPATNVDKDGKFKNILSEQNYFPTDKNKFPAKFENIPAKFTGMFSKLKNNFADMQDKTTYKSYLQQNKA